jgi:hypothetical protein
VPVSNKLLAPILHYRVSHNQEAPEPPIRLAPLSVASAVADRVDVLSGQLIIQK